MNRLNNCFHGPFIVSVIILAIAAACSKTGNLHVVSQTAGPVKVNCHLLYELPSRQAAIFDVAGTPGHSAGGVCFSCDNLLFTGDVLSYRSVGNTSFYLASRPDLVKSVRKLYRLFPDSTVVYPGHGRITDIGSEKLMNRYISLDDGEWDIK